MSQKLVSELKSVESQIEELNRQASILRERARQLRQQVVPLTVCGWVVGIFNGKPPLIQPASVETVSYMWNGCRICFRVDASDGHLVFGVDYPEGCFPFKLPDGGYDNRSNRRLIGYFRSSETAELFARVDHAKLPKVDAMSRQFGVWTPTSVRFMSEPESCDSAEWDSLLETP